MGDDVKSLPTESPTAPSQHICDMLPGVPAEEAPSRQKAKRGKRGTSQKRRAPPQPPPPQPPAFPPPKPPPEPTPLQPFTQPSQSAQPSRPPQQKFSKKMAGGHVEDVEVPANSSFGALSSQTQSQNPLGIRTTRGPSSQVQSVELRNAARETSTPSTPEVHAMDLEVAR